MATSRRNTSQRLTLVILVLASVTLVTLNYRGPVGHGIGSIRNGVRDAVSPFQRVLSDVFKPAGDFFAGAVNYSAVADENATLRNQVGLLRRQALENETAQQQLDQLLQQERLPYLQNSRSVIADVIQGVSSNYELTIEINRGTADGVGKGMPVVAGAGLIGTVIDAGSTTSVVRLITDPGSRVGVRFATTGTIAVATGQGLGHPLALAQVPASAPIPRLHQLLVTSGLQGAAFPAGIPVGIVSEVQTAHVNLTRPVLADPVAYMTDLQFVAVMQWLPAP